MKTLLLVPLFFACSVFANPIATNLDDLSEAQTFSQELLKDVGSNSSFVVYHLGSKLPDELQWVILELDKAGHKVSIKQISEQEVLDDLESDAVDADRLLAKLSYSKNIEPNTSEQIRRERIGMRERASMFAKSLFGIPKGFSFWFKIKRTSTELKRDFLGALVQAGLAGSSVALTFYGLSQIPGKEDTHYLAAGLALGIWHGLNMFYMNNVLALFGQGRMVKKISRDEWQVTKNTNLIRTLSFVRSMITNFIVMSAAFGPGAALAGGAIWQSVKNSFSTLFSRFWFDELSVKKQASINADGSVQIKKGQWSTKKMFWVRQIFEFSNGMLKNAHLANLSWLSWIFPASGAYGVIKTIYQDKKTGFENTVTVFKTVEKNACSLILLENPAESTSGI